MSEGLDLQNRKKGNSTYHQLLNDPFSTMHLMSIYPRQNIL